LRLAKDWRVREPNPGGGEVSRSRPDRPWGPPSLLYMGTVSFPEVKRPGVVFTTHPHLAPRLKKGRSIHLLPLWAFVVCYRDNTVFPARSLSPSDDSSTAQTTLRRVRHTDKLCSRAYHQDTTEKNFRGFAQPGRLGVKATSLYSLHTEHCEHLFDK